ncbi:MAG: sugar transferase [Dorea sp.]|nr:sugar transferase [Dorea sp.]
MYKDGLISWLKHLDFMIIDILCFEFALFLAYGYREGFVNGSHAKYYVQIIPAIIIIDICVVFFLNSYHNIIYRTYSAEIKQSVIHCAVVIAGLIVWLFLLKTSYVYSRTIIFIMYPISTILSAGLRLCWKRIIRTRMKKKEVRRNILVVTTDEQAEAVVDGLLIPYRDYQIVAVAVYDNPKRVGDKIGKIPIVAGKRNLQTYIKEHIVDEVFIDLKGYEKDVERMTNLFVSMGLTVHINLIQFKTNLENKEVHGIGEFTVMSTCMKFASPVQLVVKRMMDIAGGLVGLVICGIAMLIYGPIIKKQSPGPILFSQERVGRNGRIFKIYKLRTMYMDAEERKKELMEQNKMDGFMFKMDNDPRIFPIGHFLRKASIDELPQFWNVLKGDMSLVGTRPPTVDEYEQYDAKHMKRLATKPGITGLWQVSGRSNIVDFEKVVALDSRYITDWSIGLDCLILWKTVLIVLRGEGAV